MIKTVSIVAATMLLLVASPAQAAVWGGFDSTRVNYASGTIDGASHSELRAIIIAAGDTIGSTTATITGAYLSGIDVFYTSLLRDSAGFELSAAEQTALQDWIAAGGILIMTGDVWHYPTIETFTSFYGVTSWAENNGSGFAVAGSHATTAGVTGYGPAGGSYSQFTHGADATVTLTLNGLPFAVALDVESGFASSGCIYVIGDHNQWTDSYMTSSDHAQLFTNVVAWTKTCSVTGKINEIRINTPGADSDEFIELIGTPGASLTGLTLVVIGDGAAGTHGTIENVTDLTGSYDANGFFVVAEGTFTIGTADQTATLAFENNDNVTYLLVRGFTGSNGDDLDTDDDGVLDVTPWSMIVDQVAIIDAPGAGDHTYSTTQVGPDGANAPGHVMRCTDGIGEFIVALFPIPGDDTPGAANDCPVCGDGLLQATEVCDGDGAGNGGETATCNIDCTAVICGDGIANMTAGEPCDGDGAGAGGETAVCDVDCTAVTCGDGIANMTAGEVCDGDGAGTGGETATCDADCSLVSCGDGIANTAAGEACDGDGMGTGGETATCDIDCSLVTCGDGIANTTAGEACDGDGAGIGGETATCDTDCSLVSCGDGIANTTAGEACDGDGAGSGGETAACDTDCTAATCGDGVINNTAGETCEGGKSASCDSDCTAVTCGDGHVNTVAGEQCDGDGAGTPGETATCDSDCTSASCGDMVVNTAAGEACDDGAETTTCNSNCSAVACGDGVTNSTAGEACDDGGESAGCNADCSTNACGDGTLNATAGETCDDGNSVDGDGCSASCIIEEPASSGGGCCDSGGGGNEAPSAFLLFAAFAFTMRRRRNATSA